MTLKPPGIDLPEGYGVLALSRASNQSIPNNVSTSVLWETEITDNAGMFTLASPGVVATIPAAGVYAVTVNVALEPNATGQRRLDLTRNGLTFASTTFKGVATYEACMCVSAIAYFAVGDTIRTGITQDSGGALTLYGSSGPIGGVFAGVARLG